MILNKIKLYTGIAISAIAAALVGLLKYQSNRADKAVEKAEEAENEAMHANQRAEMQKELNQVKVESEKRKIDSEKIIQQIKDSRIRPDEFSSNSMFDD